jgi:hypothetical protein
MSFFCGFETVAMRKMVEAFAENAENDGGGSVG